jgi:hypothetical protein|tara:strand:+ start:3456 stop:4022 length:567 start_codon:yes stop_codon:yes gene_type:complete
MWREIETGNLIREGSSWINANGIKHPRNWHIWSEDEKKSAGLEEIIPDPIPNEVTWWYTQDADGTVTKTAKKLDDENATDQDGNLLKDDKGNQIVTRGVKSILIERVKEQQGNLLSQTDWAIIRKADKGTAIPSNIQTWRDAIRTKATEMETAINNAVDTEAIEALFLVTDQEGNVTGILYDWPELVE